MAIRTFVESIVVRAHNNPALDTHIPNRPFEWATCLRKPTHIVCQWDDHMNDENRYNVQVLVFRARARAAASTNAGRIDRLSGFQIV